MKKICVIGAGTMGSGIAAQVANSKVEVLLLDVVDENSTDPSNVANLAVKKMDHTKPPPLSHPSLVKYIHAGNLRDDLNLISSCDLIIEAIIEKLDIKHKLYDSLIPYLKKDAIIASNTSTLPLALIKEKLPEEFGKRFFITHFFNPPRYMELLELVTDKNSDEEAAKQVANFMKYKLGKTIINCNDTPGFIANRVGCFLLELTVREAISVRLDPFIVDKIFSQLLGFPSTGIFGLYDLIGHDVMKLISDSLTKALPKDDDYQLIYKDCSELLSLKNKGALGRKAGMGFYKMIKVDGRNQKQQIDFDLNEYVNVKDQNIPETIDKLYENNDQYSLFFKKILSRFFTYLTGLIPEISSSTNDVDEAMKLGYSLKYGFFELLEKKIPDGRKFLENLDPKYMVKSLTEKNDWQCKSKSVLSNDSATLLEYNNQHIFVINTKMNCLTDDLFYLLIKSVKYSEDKSTNLIIYPSNSKHFSVGANLKFIHEKINNKDFQDIEDFIKIGQKAMMELKNSSSPIISCATGFALGGGCELLLHSDYVIAHQNLNAGLVELGVGLIPSFGGVKEIFMRFGQEKDKLIQALQNILTQYKTSSGDYFVADYKANGQINMNAESILNDALKLKLARNVNHTNNINIVDVILAQEIDVDNFDHLQRNILGFFQTIIDMKAVSEEQLLQYEREKFMELVKQPLCAERLKQYV